MYVTGDEDYVVPPDRAIKAKFRAGETRASVEISIINDYKIEEIKTFRLYIFDLSLPYGVDFRSGSPRSVMVNITDDDSKYT